MEAIPKPELNEYKKQKVAFESQIADLKAQLTGAQNQFIASNGKNVADQKEVERIKTQGGIYRFPQEPTVWLVRGGKRYRIRNPADFDRLEPGRTTDDAEVNEHIASIPIEAGSQLK